MSDLGGLGILITGGTGSFARAFIPMALKQGARRIVALGRHELEMARLESEFGHHDQMRFYLGDVRDQERLVMAMRNIDIVVHAAALKRIEQCERDPFEAVHTNVYGSENVIKACLKTGVSRCLLLSTDKAVAPINLYGATKLTAERLFLAANGPAAGNCTFGVVRYGNIWGSRGSVARLWIEARDRDLPLMVTKPTATRFFMKIEEAVDLVLRTLVVMQDGPTPVVVPDLMAYLIGDLIQAFEYDNVIVTGLPPYEKLHETMDDVVFSNAVDRLSVHDLKKEIWLLS